MITTDCPIVKEIDPALLAAAGTTLAAFKTQLRAFGDTVQQQMQADPPNSSLNAAKDLHFLSVSIIDDMNYAPPGERSYPEPAPRGGATYLCLELNCDFDRAEYLSNLVIDIRPQLEVFLRYCQGYDPNFSDPDMAEWMEKDARDSLFYVANPGRSRPQIRDAEASADEHRLLLAAREIAEREQAGEQGAWSRGELWRRIRSQLILHHPELWALVGQPPHRPYNVLFINTMKTANFSAWLSVLLGVIAVALGIWGFCILFLPTFGAQRQVLIEFSTPQMWPLIYYVSLIAPLVFALPSFVDCLWESPRRIRIGSRILIVLQCLLRGAGYAALAYAAFGLIAFGVVYFYAILETLTWAFAASVLTVASLAVVLLLRLVLGNLIGLIAGIGLLSIAGLWPAMRLAILIEPALSAAPLWLLMLVALLLLWLVLLTAGVAFVVVIVAPVLIRSIKGPLRGSLLAFLLIGLFVLLVIGILWLLSQFIALPSFDTEPLRFLQYLVPALAVVVLAVGALVAYRMWRSREHEQETIVSYRALTQAHMDQMRHRENRAMQNHFISVTDIRPECLRTLRMSFRIVAFAHKWYFNRGYLATIPSIHCARWLTLPGDDRMAFLTNYDGDFDGYLGDFQSVVGVTSLWSNTIGFPRAFMLFWDGSRSEQLFKNFARNSQVESLVWFSAYPEISVQEIDRATAVREALRRKPDTYGHGWWDRIKRAWHQPIGDVELSRLFREELLVR